MRRHRYATWIALLLMCVSFAQAGPFSPGKGGPNEDAYVDAGIAGFVGPDGPGQCNPGGTSANYVNPYFAGWAHGVEHYSPSDKLGDYDVDSIGRPPNYALDYGDPTKATGPATGDHQDIVSLGDRDATEIATDAPAGSLTLHFAKPIINGLGADFATFENGSISGYSTGAGTTAGQMFAELGFVEVSSDGVHFARFPSEYLNYPDGQAGGDPDGDGVPENIVHLTQDVSNIRNLAGKHANAYGQSWGTPFNLDDLAENPLVLDGTVDLNDIRYVRIVDIAGDGSTTDSAGNGIYDSWVTWGSGGLDVDAVGVVHQLTDPGLGQTVQAVNPGGDTWAHWGQGRSELDVLFGDTVRGDGTAVDVSAQRYSGAGMEELSGVLSAWDLDAGDLTFEADGGATMVFHLDPSYAGDGSDLLALRWTGSSWEQLAGPTFDPAAGVLTVTDVTEFSPLAVIAWVAGDLDLDGSIDFQDAWELKRNQVDGLTGLSWRDGDLNGDGIVDRSDALILLSNYVPGPDQMSTEQMAGYLGLPEPATLAVLAAGSLTLLRRRGRRRR